MSSQPATYPGYRFPAEVMHSAVWLYHVFSLSLRDIELILAERGVVVSHESVSRWCLRFGADFAAKLRKRRPKPPGTLAGRATSSSLKVKFVVLGVLWMQSGRSDAPATAAKCWNTSSSVSGV
ncbi:hypothetical protein ACFQX4_21065 [Roseomonas sp. GCM10028921]